MPYVANARMYSVNPVRQRRGTSCLDGWHASPMWICTSSITRFRYRCRACGRVTTSLAPLCADFPMGFLRIHRGRSRRPFLLGGPFPGNRSMRRAWWCGLDSTFNSLEDTFGGRLGYTVEDSQSGYNALRHHLLPYYRKRGAKLYCERRRSAVHAEAGDRRAVGWRN